MSKVIMFSDYVRKQFFNLFINKVKNYIFILFLIQRRDVIILEHCQY